MNIRSKLIFLTVVLSLGVAMLLIHQVSRLTASPIVVYRAHNSTYLEELNDAKVKMNDPLLITAIREKFLRPPFPRNVPYKLKGTNLYPTSLEMAENIAYMLRYEANGFFVEARAFDGETHSNTLILERRLNWTGLLVEPDPIKFVQIEEKKRKVWLSPSCLSLLNYPHVIPISQDLNTGETSKFRGRKKVGYTDVQCLPLYSLLLALNRTVVDYLSLDVKGNELNVLKTIPFKDVDIRALSLDYLIGQKGKSITLQYLQNVGYYLHASAVHSSNQYVIFMFLKQNAVSEI